MTCNIGRQQLEQLLGAPYPTASVDDGILCGEYHLSSLTLSVSPSRRQVGLDLLVVNRWERGTGNGTRFMTDLCEACEQAGFTLGLFVSKDFGATSERRLKEFYKRFGFRENKGRYADLSVSYSMIRKPDTPTKTTAL